MTFARGVFAFALIMLITGILGSRWIVQTIFGPNPISLSPHVAVVHDTPAARHTSTPTAVPSTTTAPTQVASRVLPTSVTIAPVSRQTHVPRAKATATMRPTPRATRTRVLSTPKLPSPTPMTGIVTLANYWVGTAQARRGQTVSVGYVINNGTGSTTRVMLGASIKAARVVSWVSGTVSDPAHDVVAVVPPGITTHVRYFTLPHRVRPGVYDVAWGLRDAASGARDALVMAPSVLQVAG